MASLTLLSQNDKGLTLQQHLELQDEILNASVAGELQPTTMAQTVPNPQPVGERRRVKVYELRNNDWFDRGTGFASASVSYIPKESYCQLSSARSLRTRHSYTY